MLHCYGIEEREIIDVMSKWYNNYLFSEDKEE